MLPFFEFSDTSLIENWHCQAPGKDIGFKKTNDSIEAIGNIMNKYHNATLLANDKILQHFATILETMYKNSVLESYLLINTKE